MKGTPEAPRCGFSRRVAALLDAALAPRGRSWGHFDILADPAVRGRLKEISDWPTYPQLYVNKEFVGGCDIVEQMAEAGELEGAL